jgi:hypothetical protein
MNNKSKNNIKKESGFKVPENYFESIEDRFFDKIKIDKLTDKEGFNVPENYFESIEDNVFEKINSEKELTQTKETNVISFRERVVKRFIPIAIAASFLIFSGIIYFNNQKLNFDKLAQNDIENWIDNNINEIDSNTITDVYQDATLEDISSFDDDELIDYLKEKDLELIINESL